MSVETTPLVSVIVTNYNYSNYVVEAIESILNQTYRNLEVIVIDDGSEDDSVEIIKKAIKRDKRARLITQPNRGVVIARNRCMDESKGEYILYVDSDDKIPSMYVEKLLSGARVLNLDIAYCDYKRFGDDTSRMKFPEFDIELIKAENIVHMSSLIKRGAIGKHRFDEELNRETHEDWDFFLGLALCGLKFGKVPGVELLYRAHGQSRSGDIKSPNELNQQGFRLYGTYMYIINKYKNMYPGKIDITEKSEIIGWWRTASERLAMIRDYQIIVEEQDRQLRQCRLDMDESEKRVAHIVNSRAYKISRVLVMPRDSLNRLLRRLR